MAHARVDLNHARSPSTDWSNQELAEFYRVGEILRRSGWMVDVDRGRTDEGEPWLVYCDQRTGDVITHFAKIDDAYVVAGTVLDTPLKGASFSVLLDRLMARFTTPQQLHAVRATGTITYAHPIASLVALVAAMCALNDIACSEATDMGCVATGDHARDHGAHHHVSAEASSVDTPPAPPVNARAALRGKISARAEDGGKEGEVEADHGAAPKYGALIVNLVATVIGFAAGSLLEIDGFDHTVTGVPGHHQATASGHADAMGWTAHPSVDYAGESSQGAPALTAVDLRPDVQVGADDEVRIAHVIVAEMAVA
jgi:hypothetical protein